MYGEGSAAVASCCTSSSGARSQRPPGSTFSVTQPARGAPIDQPPVAFLTSSNERGLVVNRRARTSSSVAVAAVSGAGRIGRPRRSASDASTHHAGRLSPTGDTAAAAYWVAMAGYSMSMNGTSARSSGPAQGRTWVASAVVSVSTTSRPASTSSRAMASVRRVLSGNEVTGLPPMTTSARRFPDSISSRAAATGNSPPKERRSGRERGPSASVEIGVGSGPSRSSPTVNPGLNRFPPSRSAEPVTTSRARASHSVRLAVGAMVAPVPVWIASRP